MSGADPVRNAAHRSVRQIPPPPEIRELCTLSAVNYTDAFLVEISPQDTGTPEQWARATLEDAPAVVRMGLTQGWFALGLKLGSPHEPGHVLGWRIRANTPGLLLLGADSRLGLPAELLFKLRPGTLLFATFVGRENAAARAMWTGVGPLHRRIVRHLLEDARRRANASVRGF